MGVIVQFQKCEDTRMESNRVNLARVILNRKDGVWGVVRGISFNNKRLIRNPMREYRGGGEGKLEGFK